MDKLGVDRRQAALSDISADPRLDAVFRYWQALAGDRPMPEPRDIDPTGLPPAVLPYITLFDVIDEGRTFRMRLVGSASVAAVGSDYTGKYLDESMSGDVLTAARARYRAAIAHRRPVLGYAEFVLPDGVEVTNLMMTLPLATGGGAVDRLIGVYAPKSDWLARQALHNLETAPYVKVKRRQVVL